MSWELGLGNISCSATSQRGAGVKLHRGATGAAREVSRCRGFISRIGV